MSKMIFNCPLGHFEPGTVELDLSSRINTFVGINNIGKSKLVEKVVDLGARGYGALELHGKISTCISSETPRFEELASFVGMSAGQLSQRLTNYTPKRLESVEITLYTHQNGHVFSRINELEINELNSNRMIKKHFFEFDSFETVVGIAAERDFQSSGGWAANTTEPYVSNGSNTPKAYEYLQNDLGIGREIIINIVSQLNEILAPDFKYSELFCQRSNDGPLIALKGPTGEFRKVSELGSGLKTILQILMVVNGYSFIWNRDPTCLIIEELENNLHPRAIRRTIDIIVQSTQDKNTRLIFITHSPVVMEHLATAHGASTHHVFQEDKKPRCLPVRSFKETCEALDTIGARASDILQANFVIWVEGPTEQIVLPHFIKQLAPDLVLGTDYIIALYGGKLLLHFSADMPTEAGDHRIEVARLNRNFAFVMDNDAGVDGKVMPPGKTAIFEAQDNGVDFPIWKTRAREFEGIYPNEVFLATYGEVENDKAFVDKELSWGCKRIVEEAWPSKKDKQINKVSLAREAVKHEFLPTEKEDLEALTKIIEAIRFAKRS
jgi:putative ATP-dependent endonuclease of OLD family